MGGWWGWGGCCCSCSENKYVRDDLFYRKRLFPCVVFSWFILCCFLAVYAGGWVGGGDSKYWLSPSCSCIFSVIVTSNCNHTRDGASWSRPAAAICINVTQFSAVSWSEHSSIVIYKLNFNSVTPIFALCPTCRWETLRVSPVRPAVTWLLGHDQAPADSRRRLSLPVHRLHGVLQQPGRHAETRQEPRRARLPPRLEHQQHLPVQLTHLTDKAWDHYCILADELITNAPFANLKAQSATLKGLTDMKFKWKCNFFFPFLC